MSTTVALVYKYRQLIGRCHAGFGLDFDSIDELSTIEALFAPSSPRATTFASKRVSMKAMLRSESLQDRVTVVELGPTGCVCRQAPYAEVGDMVELIVEDEDGALSYRFKARVESVRDDVHDDFVLALELVGVPILVHYGSAEDTIPSVAALVAA